MEVFRKYFSDSQLKIEKTGQMLRETSLTIAEIAAKAGFESEFYFSRIFKKKMGQDAKRVSERESGLNWRAEVVGLHFAFCHLKQPGIKKPPMVAHRR